MIRAVKTLPLKEVAANGFEVLDTTFSCFVELNRRSRTASIEKLPII